MLRQLPKFAILPLFLASPLLAQSLDVAKNAGCGCCSAWIEQMQDAGFEVTARNISNQALYDLKQSLGVPEEMASCHTATVGNYVIEGHVPVSEINRLLAEQPYAVGLATPGMPVGAPGMEYGDRKDAYTVYLIGWDGRAEAYASYAGN